MKSVNCVIGISTVFNGPLNARQCQKEAACVLYQSAYATEVEVFSPIVREGSTMPALLPPRHIEHGGAPRCGRWGGRQRGHGAESGQLHHRRWQETSVRNTLPHRPATGLPAQRLVGTLFQKHEKSRCCVGPCFSRCF